MKKRPMPDDFREHAREPVVDLAKQCRTSFAVIRLTAAAVYPYRTAYGFRWRFVNGRAVL